MKRIERSFNTDLYPTVLSKNLVSNCPWMDDLDQGKKKKELYTFDDYDFDSDQTEKSFLSLEELELELFSRGWDSSQIYVKGIRPGYGWLIYPLEKAKILGDSFRGLDDSYAIDKLKDSLYVFKQNGTTGSSWNILIKKIANTDLNLYTNVEDEFESAFRIF